MRLRGLITPGLISILMCTLLMACDDSGVKPEYKTRNRGVFICNEGNFTFGNASLSYYDPDSLRVYNQVFYNTNLFPPGDVIQSMTIRDSIGFMVINNSGKILVINKNSFKHIATISGLNSPRYMKIAGPAKGYVTDLYTKSIAIINPLTYEITGSIPVGASTEQLVLHGEDMYVAGWSMNNKIYKIDTRSDSLIDSLTVTLQPNSIVSDRNNMLWVLSDGAYEGSPAGHEIAALTKIDPVSFTIQHAFTFPGIEYSPSGLCINSTGDSIYYINGSWSGSGNQDKGVYKMSVDAVSLPDAPIIPEKKRLFYGLGVDPVNSDIYVSDALDYLQKGWVFRYSAGGYQLDSFKVDIAPGSFCFK